MILKYQSFLSFSLAHIIGCEIVYSILQVTGFFTLLIQNGRWLHRFFNAASFYLYLSSWVTNQMVNWVFSSLLFSSHWIYHLIIFLRVDFLKVSLSFLFFLFSLESLHFPVFTPLRFSSSRIRDRVYSHTCNYNMSHPRGTLIQSDSQNSNITMSRRIIFNSLCSSHNPG